MARNLGLRKMGKYPIEFKAKAAGVAELDGFRRHWPSMQELSAQRRY